MCVKLVTYRNYTAMHGQQDIKFCNAEIILSFPVGPKCIAVHGRTETVHISNTGHGQCANS
jgi:hypothetical protein